MSGEIVDHRVGDGRAFAQALAGFFRREDSSAVFYREGAAYIRVRSQH